MKLYLGELKCGILDDFADRGDLRSRSRRTDK